MKKQGKLPNSVALVSGGLDSVVNLYMGYQRGYRPHLLWMDYGQKARRREWQVAAFHAKKLGLPITRVGLDWLKQLTKTDLVAKGSMPPMDQEVSLSQKSVALKTASRVWVPARNLIFLSVAGAWCDALGCRHIIVGFNAEEAQTFPDNRKEFALDMNRVFRRGTQVKPLVLCWSFGWSKKRLVRWAKSRISLAQLWPCYLGGQSWCGRCESCQRFQRALQLEGVSWDECYRQNQIFMGSSADL